MINFPNYDLTNSKGCIRWINWKEFLLNEKNIRKIGNNKIGILCLFYSSFFNIKKIYSCIEKEKYKDKFDLILINNSGKSQDFDKELSNNNLIILTPISNLGTDGGYSLGMEYCINKGYDYLFIIEDDVILLDDNTFSDVIDGMQEDKLGFILPSNQDGEHSRYVQFGCYPIKFLKKCGVLDPRFFTRGGDGLWFYQILKIIENYGYEKLIINKRFFHPYLKKGNFNPRWIYFARRNLLWYSKEWITTLLKLFMYIWTGVIKFFVDKSLNYLKGIFLGIFDYVCNRRNLNVSQERMQYFLKYVKQPNKLGKELSVKLTNVKDYTSGMFGIGFSKPDSKYFFFNNTIISIFKCGVVLINKNCPIYPVSLLSRKTIICDEICYNSVDYDCHIIIKNIGILCFILNIFVFCTGFIIALLLWFVLLIILALSTFINKFKFKGKQ